jgi:poly(3-hydroxybutyrate) depolymerase
VKCTGPNAKMPAIVVVHGTADTTVNPANADRIVAQMTAMNDLIDDGAANDSQNLDAISNLTAQVPNGRSYTTTVYGGQGVPHIEKILVDGMVHAWSGAYQSGQFADPSGPNASEMIWQFLNQHSLPR